MFFAKKCFHFSVLLFLSFPFFDRYGGSQNAYSHDSAYWEHIIPVPYLNRNVSTLMKPFKKMYVLLVAFLSIFNIRINAATYQNLERAARQYATRKPFLFNQKDLPFAIWPKIESINLLSEIDNPNHENDDEYFEMTKNFLSQIFLESRLNKIRELLLQDQFHSIMREELVRIRKDSSSKECSQ